MKRSAVLGIFLGLGATGSPLSGQRPAGGAEGDPVPPAPRLYVANQDDATVSIINLAPRRVIETLDLQKYGFTPDAKPHHAQVDPDGRHWYLTLIGAGKVLKLDRQNRIVAQANLEVPGLLALHPTRDLLVVGRSMSAVNPPRRIALIRRSDMKVLEEYDVFFPRPHALVVDPRGEWVYVASLGVNQLAAVRLADGEQKLVEVEGPSHAFTQFAVSPDGKWLALTAESSGNLLVFDIADPSAPRLARTVQIGGGPFEPVFTWDGRKVFVTNLDANRVTVLDTGTWAVAGVVTDAGFRQPHGVAASPDGKYIWISNRSQAGGAHDHEGRQATGPGTATAICIPTLTVEVTVPVGNYAAGMGIAAPARPPATPTSCR